MAILGLENGLSFIIFTNPYPIIGVGEIQWGKLFNPAKYKVINLQKKTLGCTSWEEILNVNEKRSCAEVMWCNYIQDV